MWSPAVSFRNACRLLTLIIAGGNLLLIAGCASSPDEPIYHFYRYMVDVHPGVKNIRYRYGQEAPRYKPNAKAGVGASYGMTMPLPETFEISWETHDGKQHQATVPVRSRIANPIKGKTILFVIKYDSIEGYVKSTTAEDRFY